MENSEHHLPTEQARTAVLFAISADDPAAQAENRRPASNYFVAFSLRIPSLTGGRLAPRFVPSFTTAAATWSVIPALKLLSARAKTSLCPRQSGLLW